MGGVVVFLTLFTYGSNLLLYFILKPKKHIHGLEKFSIFFGINMTVLLLNGLFLFLGKFLYDNGLLYLE